MNKGMTLAALAQELIALEAEKKDFIVPSTKMEMIDGRKLLFNENEYEVSTLAHEQIGARLNIPRDYYKKMQAEAPDLLDRNVNTWLRRTPERRFVRTRSKQVRAVLSDRFKPRENAGIVEVMVPVLQQAGNVQVMSSNLSEKNMYIKAISHELQGEVRVGQVVKGGISIRNSEVGCGAFEISMFILTLACMNGMLREHSMKEFHVGKRLAGSDAAALIYSQETIAKDNEAFHLALRDNLRYAFNKDEFEKELQKFRNAAENPLNVNRISETIDDVTKRFSLTQHESKDILGRLAKGGDFTQWGLSSAVTNLANDLQDYERSTDLERIGGQIIDLNPSQWRSVARLAA